MLIKTTLNYDALDQQVAITSPSESKVQMFYNADRLVTEIQGSRTVSVFRSTGNVHAQHQTLAGARAVILLASNQQQSVLSEFGRRPPIAYTPYGFRHPMSVMGSVLAFNGERPTAVTGHYLLGNGRRAFNPVLMRFNSPDKLSPFGLGDINAFAYCKGDPVNFGDPSGQFFKPFLELLNSLQSVLKNTWLGYASVIRPMPIGVLDISTVVTRAGIATKAVGWGMHYGGYAAGKQVIAAGAGIMSAGKVLEVGKKLGAALRSGEAAKALRYRVNQVLRRAEPLTSTDVEVGRIRR